MDLLIGVTLYAEMWDVKPETVRKWCREGIIQGAEQDGKGKPWRIPETAAPPERIMKRKEKNTKR